jgi:hypothetical protein
LPSNRELVTEAFAAWSDETGYVTSIFAEDTSSTVIVLWDGSGMMRVGTRYETRMPGS